MQAAIRVTTVYTICLKLGSRSSDQNIASILNLCDIMGVKKRLLHKSTSRRSNLNSFIVAQVYAVTAGLLLMLLRQHQ